MKADKSARRPVGRPRANGKPPLSREAVFATATRLIAQHGYAGTSLRMIAQALDAQAPSITQLFKTKDNLLNELVQRLAKVSLDFHEQLSHERLAADVRLYKMLFEETRAIASAHHDIASIFYLPELRKPQFKAAQQERASMIGWYRQTLDQGVQDNLFVSTNMALSAEQVFQLTETGIIALEPALLGEPQAQAKATADFVLRGLLRRPARLSVIEKKARGCRLTMVD
ncbi:MAG: TetR/AcrR family transcriptional regulator [bacterium]